MALLKNRKGSVSKKSGRLYLEPVFMWLMISGIISIVQPWSLFLHRYGTVIMLAGFAGFTFFSHMKSPPEKG